VDIAAASPHVDAQAAANDAFFCGARMSAARQNDAKNSARARHVATFACHVATVAGDGRD